MYSQYHEVYIVLSVHMGFCYICAWICHKIKYIDINRPATKYWTYNKPYLKKFYSDFDNLKCTFHHFAFSFISNISQGFIR